MLVAEQRKVESTAVVEAMAAMDTTTAEAMVAEAVALKDAGNDLFSAGDFDGAKDKYHEVQVNRKKRREEIESMKV
jgi:hypothetical protein